MDLDGTNIEGVFFDIDDTFSSEGKITAEAYTALWKLKNAGITMVPITGRPAGWCDHIARMWPVTAIIGENGAFYFMMKGGRMTKHYTADPSRRSEYKERLQSVREEIMRDVPGTDVASDQDYREFELAIDYCEDVTPLPHAAIDSIEGIFQKHGATCKTSSVHVNGWFGDYDKLTTAKIFIEKELGLNPDADNDKFTFAGDSPNDEPMFTFFNNSVGVANVMDFADRIQNMPKYVTKSKSGAGFSELASLILHSK